MPLSDVFGPPPPHHDCPQPHGTIYYVGKDTNTTTIPPVPGDGPIVPTVIELATQDDPVNHPSHYTAFGAEVIEITEHLSFNRGNAIKYIARAGLKDKDKELQDLEKALWYLTREIGLYRKQHENGQG